MKKYLYIIILITAQQMIFAQPDFQRFLSDIAPISSSTTRQAMVDSFITKVKQAGGGPVVNGNVASFLYQGTAASAVVTGDFNSWGITTSMTKLAGTNLFYYSAPFPLNARLDYKFIIPTNNYILDPLNSHTCSGGYGPNSELAMPEYVQPWAINLRGAPRGTIINKTIYSTNLSATYQLYIYLPPGYNSIGAQMYPSVYFHDGQEYLSLGSAQNVIENLLDSNKIVPAIGVFIQPINRTEEYAGSKRNAYRLFIVNELVPYIDANYHTIKSPRHRVVIGTSYGANISALIVYNHPDVFGICGLHSPAFYANNNEVLNLILPAPPKDVQYYSAWGTFEETYTWMRPFRDSLKLHGFKFDWLERPEGHSWGLWRATLDSMLISLLPNGPSHVEGTTAPQDKKFSLKPCYPNPFNGMTTVEYKLTTAGIVNLSLYDVSGKRVKGIVHQWQESGSKTLHLSANDLASGTYFLRLQVNDAIETRAIVLLK